jgi:Uma2 family endonuclease
MSVGQVIGQTAGSEINYDDRNYEVVNGQRVELPPMSAHETDLNSRLNAFIAPIMLKHGRPQIETLFLIDSETDLQRRPDMAFISFARWPKGRRVPTTNAWEVVPDLAVEVVSFSNSANEIITKIHDYFRCGVRLVWVVYPLFAQVYVYTSTTTVRILGRADTLDGGEVLPEFRLTMAELFELSDESGA